MNENPIRFNSRPFAANAFAFGCGFVTLCFETA
jgi:hypothetical protein